MNTNRTVARLRAQAARAAWRHSLLRLPALAWLAAALGALTATLALIGLIRERDPFLTSFGVLLLIGAGFGIYVALSAPRR